MVLQGQYCSNVVLMLKLVAESILQYLMLVMLTMRRISHRLMVDFLGG